MKSEKIRNLKRIIDALTPNEQGVIQDYLGCFDTRGDGYTPKTLLLYELFLAHDDIGDIIRRIPRVLKTDSESAMRMVAHRLKEKIGECLLLDVNINREGSYEDVTKARFDIAKKKMVSEIFRSRGLDKEKEQIYAKLIPVARKYELFSELVELLILKQEHVGLKHGPKQFNALEADIEFAEECRRAAINAKKAYYKAIQKYSFEGGKLNNLDYSKVLREEISQLKKDFEHTSSAIVGFYLYQLQIEYHQLIQDFSKASEYCLHVVEVVRNNAAIYHKRRLGIAYLNLSQNEIFNHYFDYALGFAKDAKKHFEAGTGNFNLAIELEFYAHFYDGNLTEAEKCLESLILSPEAEQSEFRLAWRNYLMACVHFVNKRHKMVIEHLNETKALNKDKVGWNLGVRALSIMNSVELEHFDNADSMIISMQQFMKQGLKGVALRERDETILQVLLELRRYSYDFQKVVDKKPELLEALNSDSDSLSWQVQSPELIIFHKWFESKLQHQDYVPDYRKESVRAGEKQQAEEKAK